MGMILTCKCCGKAFEASFPNAKYCSPTCRKIGTKLVRRSWEARSGYAEREKHRRRKQRAVARKAKEDERLAQELKRSELDRQRALEAEARFNAECDAGNLFALAVREKRRAGNMSREYWEYFKRREIEEAEAGGRVGVDTTVNGFSVYSDTFSDDVMESAEAIGCFRIQRTSPR